MTLCPPVQSANVCGRSVGDAPSTWPSAKSTLTIPVLHGRLGSHLPWREAVIRTPMMLHGLHSVPSKKVTVCEGVRITDIFLRGGTLVFGSTEIAVDGMVK